MTRFYFHDAANALPGSFPSAVDGSNYSLTMSQASALRSMDTSLGAGQVSETVASAANTGFQRVLVGWWVSPPLAAQTIPLAPAITLNLDLNEANTNANWATGYAVRANVWRPGANSYVGNLASPTGDDGSLVEPSAASSEQASSGAATR